MLDVRCQMLDVSVQIWDLEFGIWDLEFGIWDLAFLLSLIFFGIIKATSSFGHSLRGGECFLKTINF